MVELADCGILLDVNNIYVSSKNHSFDPYDYLNDVPHRSRRADAHRRTQQIRKIHSRYARSSGARPGVEDVRPCDRRIGPINTLLEWDAHIPSFDEVHGEALKANKFITRVLKNGASVEQWRDGRGMKRSPSEPSDWRLRLAPRRRQTAGRVEGASAPDVFRDSTAAQPSNSHAATWIDGRQTAKVVAEFIKPNDRLTSLERIETVQQAILVSSA